MKIYILASILLLSILVGCTTIAPVAPSEPPVAYIDSVSATTIVAGDLVSLTGHGTDREGTVVAYSWRSSVDGVLGTNPDLSTSSLSVAKHAIYFQVQNNRGDWSKEVYVYVNVLPAQIGKPTINIFQVKPDYVAPGDSTILSWDVSNANTVTIAPDIGNVSLTGTRTIYPQRNTIYVLTAVNEVGQIQADTKVSLLVKKDVTLEMYSIPGEDGTVRRDTIVEFDPKVGGNESGVPMQAFLSFDISMIPSDAIIKYVSLDLSNHANYGYPFNFLGAMGVYHHQYGTLESNDYVIGFSGNTLYTAYTEPLQPYVSNLFIDAVQEQVDKGSSRFQIRLQFEDFYFAEHQANYMALNSNGVKLIVTYEE